MAQVTYESPVYHQLREVIRDKIEEGEYPLCSAIPLESEMAEYYGISRQTVHNAYNALIREGVLCRVPGKGVFVLGKKVERDLDDLSGFNQTMREKHVIPSVKVVSQNLRDAGEYYGEMFGIAPEDEIYYIKRVCYANGEPVSLEEIYVPQYVIPKMGGIDLSVFSVYEIYGIYGVNLQRAEQELYLVHLDQKDARVLGIDTSLPVMNFESISYDETGRVVEFNRNYVRGDKCNFTVHFRNI